jgi:acyl-CoA reductase-like NAD-dependent aldehyde dehydrogenase
MNTQLLIGAKETPASGGKTFDRLNPITGECATRAAAASVEDANLAASAAAIAFPGWAEM